MDLLIFIGVALILGGQVTQLVLSHKAHKKTFTEIANHTLTELARPTIVTHLPIASVKAINGERR